MTTQGPSSWIHVLAHGWCNAPHSHHYRPDTCDDSVLQFATRKPDGKEWDTPRGRNAAQESSGPAHLDVATASCMGDFLHSPRHEKPFPGKDGIGESPASALCFVCFRPPRPKRLRSTPICWGEGGYSYGELKDDSKSYSKLLNSYVFSSRQINIDNHLTNRSILQEFPASGSWFSHLNRQPGFRGHGPSVKWRDCLMALQLKEKIV
ncbi:hypothetical protein B0H13DRAFT_1894706 [Mycena leptocephala]|nr:hypothetical protein B0H13DRAFT_1894706 [Mycena leptocephala]